MDPFQIVLNRYLGDIGAIFWNGIREHVLCSYQVKPRACVVSMPYLPACMQL